ncbi:MAG: glucoamylase family protein [Clostridia bacterium]
MKDLEEKYAKISAAYLKCKEKYKKEKIDVCCQWLVENMYRVTEDYKHILKNTGSIKSQGMYTQITSLAKLCPKICKRLDYTYRKAAKKTKLEQEIESIFKALDIIEMQLCEQEYIPKTSKTYTERKPKDIEESLKSKYLKYAKEAYKYFADTVNEESNFLPVDYIDMSKRKANRVNYKTSPTNICFGILSIISAEDLKYISKKQAKSLLEKMLASIDKLPKCGGLLYNWYDTRTLKNTSDYVSSVDLGNYLAALYILKGYIKDLDILDKLIRQVDFSKLYCKEKRGIYISYNAKEKVFLHNVYDRFLSESRTALLLAIGNMQIDESSFYVLKREEKDGALLSWTGTAFEYFLPNIFWKTYEGSILDKSIIYAYKQQKQYMKENALEAFGISACAYPKKNKYNEYLYKEFGIPNLRLRIDKYEDYVVTPHASILACSINPKEVMDNLEVLETLNMRGKYGLLDSIDLDKRTKNANGTYKVAKIYFTHNLGMIISSINNLLNKDILKTRMYTNDAVKKADKLLKTDI